jgi:3-oxoacyl-[acyl-carrier-protein] synthase-3
MLERRCSLDDYRCLLRDLRAQVMEGARWLARASGSLGAGQLALRGALLQHAFTEHRDFRMLESDYVATGGAHDEICAPRRNIGTEALCAWMEELSGRRDSLGILGALMIFEGVGSRLAPRIAEALQASLGLSEDQCRFITYHAANDADHQDGMRKVLSGALSDTAHVDEILRAARITGMLYVQQYRCLGEY